MKPEIRMGSTALVLLAVVGTLSACTALVPYDSEFMCEKNQDFGKCMSVSEAYKESLAGPAPKESEGHPDAWQYKEKSRGKSRGASDKKEVRGKDSGMTTVALSGRDLYKENEYRAMASLIEAPATPLVRPPKVLRTLVVSYPTGETLYMPRYIVYFAEEARFVVGDYLNESRSQVATIFPNGSGKSSTK